MRETSQQPLPDHARSPVRLLFFRRDDRRLHLRVERFFRDLTQNGLRRGVFHDAEELIMAIGEYIDKQNQSPKPFIWTANVSDILEKVKRARRSLDNRNSA